MNTFVVVWNGFQVMNGRGNVHFSKDQILSIAGYDFDFKVIQVHTSIFSNNDTNSLVTVERITHV